MALPDLNLYCTKDFFCGPDGSSRFCVPFPGGVEVCAVFPGARIPDPSELINALLQSVNAALAPLAPLFTVFEVLIALVNCVKAIQKALASFPPDPSAIPGCIAALEAALAKLLKLLPFLCIPVLVGALLDALICFLTGIRNQLLAIIAKLVRILAAQTRATQLPSIQLQLIVDCANDDVDAALVNLAANAQPIGRIIGIINAFLQLAGAQPNADGSGPIPDLASVFGTEAQAIIAPLDAAIDVLQAIRAVFP